VELEAHLEGGEVVGALRGGHVRELAGAGLRRVGARVDVPVDGVRLDEARKVAADEVRVGGELVVREGGVHERAHVGRAAQPDEAVAVDRAAVLELRRAGGGGEGAELHEAA